MKTIFRYVKINLVLFRNSLIRDAAIPGYIASNILWRVFDLVISIVFFNVIFSNVTNLAGWNYYQVLFLYAFARTIIIAHGAWTKRGVQSMATDLIRRGEFDFNLAKPVDPMIMVSISKPRIYNFLTLFLMIPLAIYAAFKSGVAIGWENVFWFLFLAICGFILYYFLEILVIIPAFWFIRLWSLSDIMNRMGTFMRYPAGVFSQGIRIAIMVLFPIITISYVPAQVLFYPAEPKYILFMIGITFIFGVITRLFWAVGQRSYNSASS